MLYFILVCTQGLMNTSGVKMLPLVIEDTILHLQIMSYGLKIPQCYKAGF